MTAEEASILYAIRLQPDEDTVRLVYADWLDEHGQPERAEFIRVQCELAKLSSQGHGSSEAECPVITAKKKRGGPGGQMMPSCRVCDDAFDMEYREREMFKGGGGIDLWSDVPWATEKTQLTVTTLARETGFRVGPSEGHPLDVTLVFRRGFADEVRLGLAAFLGGECVVCGGSGRTGGPVSDDCLGCTGRDDYIRTTGLAAAIFAAHPVTRVVPTDKRPTGVEGVGYMWLYDGPSRPGDPATLPRDLMVPPVVSREGGFPCRFDTPEAATDALSVVLMGIGRESAGLPPLKGAP